MVGECSLDVMRWGLVPFWAKDVKIGFANINTKAEGIEGKPAFREAFQRRRCLVPVDNFYGRKTAAEMPPFAITLAEPQRPQHLPIGNRRPDNGSKYGCGAEAVRAARRNSNL
jgi:hypothetical protein